MLTEQVPYVFLGDRPQCFYIFAFHLDSGGLIPIAKYIWEMGYSS